MSGSRTSVHTAKARQLSGDWLIYNSYEPQTVPSGAAGALLRPIQKANPAAIRRAH